MKKLLKRVKDPNNLIYDIKLAMVTGVNTHSNKVIKNGKKEQNVNLNIQK